MLLIILMFLFGVFLCSLSVTFSIMYLNLMNLGYSFFEYVKFICGRVECLVGILGIIFIIVSLRKGIYR